MPKSVNAIARSIIHGIGDGLGSLRPSGPEPIPGVQRGIDGQCSAVTRQRNGGAEAIGEAILS